MSKNIKKLIAVLALAGILLTPACSNTDEINSSKNGEITTSSPSSQEGIAGTGTTGDATDKPKETEGTVHVITNNQELEEYFNSISDEEIENLLDIIEDIDISDDVDIEANPGFDQVDIPEEP